MIPVWLRYGERLGGLLRRVRIALRPALLVIKPGSLGDAFLFTGALRALRLQYPGHRLVMATSARAKPVLERCPAIDVLLALDESEGGKSGVAARWQRLFFAIAVFCRPYELVVFPCYEDDAGWGALLFERVEADRKFCLSDPALRGVHEIDKTLAVLRAAGCAVVARKDIWPDVGIRDGEREWALRLAQSEVGGRRSEDRGTAQAEEGASLAEAQSEQRNICEKQSTKNQERLTEVESSVLCPPSSVFTLALCPGARFKQKQWGAEKFAELIVRLGERVSRRGAESAEEIWSSGALDVGRGTGDGRRSTSSGHPSSVIRHPSSVSLRVLILGGAEDCEIAGEILERLKTTDCRLQTSDECAGNGSLAEARRTQRNFNEEPRTKNQELIIEDYTGRCSLHESFALIEKSDLCVGNDTLGLHVAVAVGTPSVVIMWGGDGDQWIPWGDVERHRMARADVDCGGCGGACVRERHECMERISVEMVLAEVEKMSLAEAQRSRRG